MILWDIEELTLLKIKHHIFWVSAIFFDTFNHNEPKHIPACRSEFKICEDSLCVKLRLPQLSLVCQYPMQDFLLYASPTSLVVEVFPLDLLCEILPHQV